MHLSLSRQRLRAVHRIISAKNKIFILAKGASMIFKPLKNIEIPSIYNKAPCGLHPIFRNL